VQAERLHSPLSIDCIRDGAVYVLPPSDLVQTNLFLKIGRIDELFIKLPSERGFSDYLKLIKMGLSGPEDVRAIEEAERFENLDAALDRCGMRRALAASAEVAHYLAVHAIQFERLKSQNAVGVPRTRFAVSRWTRLGILRRNQPVIFQEQIPGTTLWDMFDFAGLRLKDQWQAFRAMISAQLFTLMESGLLNHIDWNIKNFVFDPIRRRLFYVDVKPTVFITRQSNEHNLKGIRDYLLL